MVHEIAFLGKLPLRRGAPRGGDRRGRAGRRESARDLFSTKHTRMPGGQAKKKLRVFGVRTRYLAEASKNNTVLSKKIQGTKQNGEMKPTQA